MLIMCGTGSTQPREDNCVATLSRRSGPDLKVNINRLDET